MTKCPAARFVMDAGFTEVILTRRPWNLNCSKNTVMAHTWTVPDISLRSHSGLAICPSGWSPTTAEPSKEFVALQ